MPEQTDPVIPIDSRLRVLRTLGLLCIFVLLMPYVALAVPKLLFGRDSTTNISWVLLVFGGFSFLIVTLFSASILFRVFGLHDIKHSLALPRNSIRSLLTFLVFMILMTFIFYSTHIVADQDTPGTMTIRKAEFAETVELLQLRDRITSRKESETDPELLIVEYLVDKKSASLEYFDRILVALLGISSTIIGFYFGSRTREDPGQEEKSVTQPGEDQNAIIESVVADGDDSDGLDWAITSESLKLTSNADGNLVGELTVMADALDNLGEFAAQFEPTKSHDAPTDAALVSVTRLGDRLTLTIEGLKAEDIEDGSQMSIFYRDQEERAQAIPIELA